MSHLRIKVNIGSFNVELEGASEEVVSQFEELKKNGLGQIVDQLASRLQANIQKTESLPDGSTNFVDSTVTDTPLDDQGISLQNVVYKQLPKSETEWVLIYGYFLEREGKVSFERKDLIQKYEESNRKSEVRIKNLSMSIKVAVTKTWISALNDKDFMVTDKGRKHALEILTRQEATVKSPKKRQKKEESEKSSPVSNESTT